MDGRRGAAPRQIKSVSRLPGAKPVALNAPMTMVRTWFLLGPERR